MSLINPETGRKIRVGGPTHRRMMQYGGGDEEERQAMLMKGRQLMAILKSLDSAKDDTDLPNGSMRGVWPSMDAATDQLVRAVTVLRNDINKRYAPKKTNNEFTK